MQVMILAAGRGTRLGPLGAALPKPLVPICGYPAITFGLALCRQAGLREVVINLHHRGDLIQEAIGDGRAHGVTVRYSVEEPELLGTGGGITRARKLFRSEPVLVMNGKVVADLDLREVIAAHERARVWQALATMVVRRDEHPEKWAPVEIDDRSRVVGLRGERGPMTVVGELQPCMFTGVHVLEGELLDRLPPAGVVSDVIGEAYLPAIKDGERVDAVMTRGYFAEHSTPDRYLEGNIALLRNPWKIPHPPGPLVGIDERATVHPTAKVVGACRIAPGAVIEAGAVVGPEVVVCTGGRVAAGARVETSVVWDGGVARGEVRGAVVTEGGLVGAG